MRDLRILYADNNNKLKFGFTDLSQAVTGPSALVQWVMTLAFTPSRSNKFSPEACSVIGDFIKESFNPEDEQAIRSQIVYGFRQIERYIKSKQLTNLRLTSDEKLKEIKLLKIALDSITMKWTIELSIVTENNRAFFAKIG